MSNINRLVLKELKTFQNELGRKRNLSIEKSPIKNFTQAEIVKILLENVDKDITQKDLEQKLNIRASTLSGVLNTMEKNNVIKRISSSNDKREKFVLLTENSLKKHNEVVKSVNELNEKLTANISKEKLEIFIEVLDAMRSNLKKEE